MGLNAPATPRGPVHWPVPRRVRAHTVIAIAFAAVAATPLAAQVATVESHPNFLLPPSLLERLIDREPFRIIDWRGARAITDRTQRIAIEFDDTLVMSAQWATAPRGGAAFNNQPRYELAAYVLQKLFLDEDEYVVPPTSIRAFPLDFVREHMPDVQPTFDEAPGSVVTALQYWLLGVTQDNVWEPSRARSDSAYARHFGNLNILTYIINHGDSNVGNVLVSQSPQHPRVYAVDNGVAFTSRTSNRGHIWRELLAERLPRSTLDRLRAIKRAELDAALAVLVEFEVRDGELVRVEPGPNLGRGRGVRKSGDRIQLGLTSAEIRDVEIRIRSLLREANARQIF
jgi:hypothetical protein